MALSAARNSFRASRAHTVGEMPRHQSSMSVGVGDWMPRITLPLASGPLFDSWDPTTSGMARVYWVGAPPAAAFAGQLAACETLLHVVRPQPSVEPSPCIVDRLGEFSHAFRATGPLA